MGFKPVRYNTGEEIFETTVRDGMGGKLDTWKVMKTDFPKCADILMKKYGLKNNKKRKMDEDLDWMI